MSLASARNWGGWKEGGGKIDQIGEAGGVRADAPILDQVQDAGETGPQQESHILTTTPPEQASADLSSHTEVAGHDLAV